MHTETRVHFGLYDVTARGDSSPASTSAQEFCDLSSDLKRDNVPAQTKYGTLESRQFLMDGSFELFPDEPSGEFWGLWSTQQSGADGRFSDPPVLWISFTQPHSSSGITLHFYGPTGDWASDVTIRWYNSAGALMRTASFRPDGVDYYCAQKVEGYSALALSFGGTNRPGRYLKLAGLDYGVSMTFSGTEVVSARVLEEVDMLSDEISINTLDLTLYNRDGAFSILNPDGVLDVLQHKQEFDVYEDIDGTEYPMGTFYLSEWENPSGTLASFTATDAIGLLDSAPYDGGVYDTTAAILAEDILSGYKYDLDEELAEEPIRGYLPICTRRTALQQLAFALGAVVDCSRSGRIRIYPPPTRPSSLITCRRKWQGSKVSLRPLITGVSITAHRYIPGTESKELYRDELDAGTYRITLSEPAAELSATGGTITEQRVNYAVVQVDAHGAVTITGKPYADAKTLLRRTAKDLPANAQTNVLEVDDATLIGPERAASVANRILEYYTQRYEQSFTMLAGTEHLGDMLIVESFGGERVRGSLERMEFDLAGGCVADVLVVGRRLSATAAAYTGEIFAGERSVF